MKVIEESPAPKAKKTGRPRAKGPFNSHEELRQAIKDRMARGYYTNQMAAIFNLNWRTIKRIVDEEARNEADPVKGRSLALTWPLPGKHGPRSSGKV